MSPASGWFIIAPFGASTGSGPGGSIPRGSKAYHATGHSYTVLNDDFTSNNATAVVIGGKRWEVVMGPFTTQQEALSSAPPGTLSILAGVATAAVAGATGNRNPAGAFNAGQQAAAGALSGLSAIGDFFTRLESGNLWVRVVKIVAGGSLLVAALVHMTGAGGAAASTLRKILPA